MVRIWVENKAVSGSVLSRFKNWRDTEISVPVSSMWSWPLKMIVHPKIKKPVIMPLIWLSWKMSQYSKNVTTAFVYTKKVNGVQNITDFHWMDKSIFNILPNIQILLCSSHAVLEWQNGEWMIKFFFLYKPFQIYPDFMF